MTGHVDVYRLDIGAGTATLVRRANVDDAPAPNASTRVSRPHDDTSCPFAERTQIDLTPTPPRLELR